jgi:hypothetical protein
VPRSGAGSPKPSPKIHILIDYESIQPRHLETRADADTRVTVFVGAHQERLPFDVVAALPARGLRVERLRPEPTSAGNVHDNEVTPAPGDTAAP